MPFTKKKSYTKKRVYKKRAYKKSAPKSRTNLVKLIKNVTLKMNESKSKTTSIAKQELNHNTYHNVHQLNGTTYLPAFGTGDDQRVGDRIHSSGYKLRLLFGQKYDRPNVTWKLWIVKQPANYVNSNTFRNVTGNVLLDPTNPDQVKVLRSYTFKPSQSSYLAMGALLANDTSKEYTFTRTIWLPHRHEYKFYYDYQQGHDENPIVMYIACYDAFGTLNTDNIGYVQISQELFYRDP